MIFCRGGNDLAIEFLDYCKDGLMANVKELYEPLGDDKKLVLLKSKDQYENRNCLHTVLHHIVSNSLDCILWS
jgi:hypothetical protein